MSKNKNNKKAARSKGKTVLLIAGVALLAGGATAGSIFGYRYLQDNAVVIPHRYDGVPVGVRLYNDDETKPVRLGAAANFSAGINGERNDFDAFPVYAGMKQSKNNAGEWVVTIPDHYVKTVWTDSYREMYVADSKIDDTYVLIPKHDVASFKGNIETANGKKALHSHKDVYPDFNFTKTEAADLAKNAGAHLNQYTPAMDLSLLMTIEFAAEDLQEVFSGFTSIKSVEDVEFDIDLQKTGKTNIVRVDASVFNGMLGDNEIADVIIPGFTSFCIQEGDGYVSSDIATITGYKKANISVQESASSSDSSSSAEAQSSTVNVYEFTLDKTIDFEAEETTLINRWKERQEADGNEDPDPDDMASPLMQFGNYVKNGITDGLKGSSHELTEFNGVKLPKGMRPYSYRGVQDWHGGLYEWLDGVQIRSVNSTDSEKAGAYIEVCNDVDLMNESKAADSETPDYKVLAKLGSGSYFAGFGESDKGHILPPVVTSDKDASMNDRFWFSSGSVLESGEDQFTLRPVYRGGDWNYGDDAGPFYLCGFDGFSFWGCRIGARLGF